jgi:hypothetical protein
MVALPALLHFPCLPERILKLLGFLHSKKERKLTRWKLVVEVFSLPALFPEIQIAFL